MLGQDIERRLKVGFRAAAERVILKLRSFVSSVQVSNTSVRGRKIPAVLQTLVQQHRPRGKRSLYLRRGTGPYREQRQHDKNCQAATGRIGHKGAEAGSTHGQG